MRKTMPSIVVDKDDLRSLERLERFKGAYGTVCVFEDQDSLQQLKER